LGPAREKAGLELLSPRALETREGGWPAFRSPSSTRVAAAYNLDARLASGLRERRAPAFTRRGQEAKAASRGVGAGAGAHFWRALRFTRQHVARDAMRSSLLVL